MNSEPFFLVGAQRSGTTLLRLMLNMHSKLSIPPESHFLLDLIKEFGKSQFLKSEEFDKAIDIIYKHPRFINWDINWENLAGLKNEFLFPIQMSELINRIFLLQIKNDSIIWGDKTPEYVDIIPQLKQTFPNARFILIYRDGRDVANSLKNRGWQGWSIFQRAQYWKDSIKKIFFLNGDSKTFFVKYEDLIEAPQLILNEICGLLDVDYEDKMLDYNINYHENITISEKKSGVHTKLARKPKKSDIYKWKNDSNIFEIWAFEAIAYRELIKTGYILSKFKPRNPLHSIGKLFYLIIGNVITLFYKSYHKMIPKSFKGKIINIKPFKYIRNKVRSI